MQKINLVLSIAVFSFLSQAMAGNEAGGGWGTPLGRLCKKAGGINDQLNVQTDTSEEKVQIGLCRLPDDSLIEDFSLDSQAKKIFLGHDKQKFDEVWLSYEQHGLTQDQFASQFCTDSGGRIKTVSPYMRPGVKYQLCEFADQSRIEIWTLFWGPFFYRDLAKAFSEN